VTGLTELDIAIVAVLLVVFAIVTIHNRRALHREAERRRELEIMHRDRDAHF
jgi:hypothetical protein